MATSLPALAAAAAGTASCRRPSAFAGSPAPGPQQAAASSSPAAHLLADVCERTARGVAYRFEFDEWGNFLCAATVTAPGAAAQAGAKQRRCEYGFSPFSAVEAKERAARNALESLRSGSKTPESAYSSANWPLPPKVSGLPASPPPSPAGGTHPSAPPQPAPLPQGQPVFSDLGIPATPLRYHTGVSPSGTASVAALAPDVTPTGIPAHSAPPSARQAAFDPPPSGSPGPAAAENPAARSDRRSKQGSGQPENEVKRAEAGDRADRSVRAREQNDLDTVDQIGIWNSGRLLPESEEGGLYSPSSAGNGVERSDSLFVLDGAGDPSIADTTRTIYDLTESEVPPTEAEAREIWEVGDTVDWDFAAKADSRTRLLLPGAGNSPIPGLIHSEGNAPPPTTKFIPVSTPVPGPTVGGPKRSAKKRKSAVDFAGDPTRYEAAYRRGAERRSAQPSGKDAFLSSRANGHSLPSYSWDTVAAGSSPRTGSTPQLYANASLNPPRKFSRPEPQPERANVDHREVHYPPVAQPMIDVRRLQSRSESAVLARHVLRGTTANEAASTITAQFYTPASEPCYDPLAPALNASDPPTSCSAHWPTTSSAASPGQPPAPRPPGILHQPVGPQANFAEPYDPFAPGDSPDNALVAPALYHRVTGFGQQVRQEVTFADLCGPAWVSSSTPGLRPPPALVKQTRDSSTQASAPAVRRAPPQRPAPASVHIDVISRLPRGVRPVVMQAGSKEKAVHDKLTSLRSRVAVHIAYDYTMVTAADGRKYFAVRPTVQGAPDLGYLPGLFEHRAAARHTASEIILDYLTKGDGRKFVC